MRTKVLQFVLFMVVVVLATGDESTNKSNIKYIQFIKETYGKNLNDVAKSLGIDDFDAKFEQFVKKYKKAYPSQQELEYRKANFLYSCKIIKDNERDHNSKIVNFKLEINQFSDMGPNDNSKMGPELLELGSIPSKPDGLTSYLSNETLAAIPQDFDWREHGALSPVQSQGPCGSCWIFAGVTVVESANVIAGNPLVKLSEQELLNCVDGGEYISKGCNGGTAADVYRYTQKNGLWMNIDLPYVGQEGDCVENKEYWKASIVDYQFLAKPVLDEDIMQAIFRYGPVATVINSGDENLKLYKSGIIEDPGDPSLTTPNNHYVTIVGWGTEDGLDYWTFRNSWGPNWGEDGYFRLLRGINNRGMNTAVSYAQASKMSPDHIKKMKQDINNNTSGPNLACRMMTPTLKFIMFVAIINWLL